MEIKLCMLFYETFHTVSHKKSNLSNDVVCISYIHTLSKQNVGEMVDSFRLYYPQVETKLNQI